MGKIGFLWEKSKKLAFYIFIICKFVVNLYCKIKILIKRIIMKYVTKTRMALVFFPTLLIGLVMFEFMWLIIDMMGGNTVGINALTNHIGAALLQALGFGFFIAFVFYSSEKKKAEKAEQLAEVKFVE